MHLVLHSMRPREVLFLAALLMASSLSSAADLELRELARFDDDLFLAAIGPSQDVTVLRAAAIDRLEAGTAPASLARSVEGQRLFLAPSGAFYGKLTHRPGAADFTPTERFELHEAGGRLVWAIEQTEDVSYAISSRGGVVGLQLNVNIPRENRLRFYGEAGERVAEVSIPHLLGGSFDPEGRRFLAVSGSEGTVGFDLAGRVVWSVPGGRLVAASSGAGIVAVAGPDRITVIRDDRVGANADLGGLLVRRIAVAADGSRIAIAGKHEIRLYDSANLLETGRIETGSESLAWTSIDFSPGADRIAAGLARDLGPAAPAERRHPDGEVRVYGADGALLHSAAMSFAHWNIFTPTALWRSSGDALTITTRRAVYETVLP